jgi:hypothetical protein
LFLGLGLLAGGLATSQIVESSELAHPTLEQLVQRSDLVVIGTAKRTKLASVTKNPVVVVAEIRIERVLKGPPTTGTVRLAYGTGYAEADSDCCKRGAKYLLFLRATPAGEFVVTSGVSSAVQIQR